MTMTMTKTRPADPQTTLTRAARKCRRAVEDYRQWQAVLAGWLIVRWELERPDRPRLPYIPGIEAGYRRGERAERECHWAEQGYYRLYQNYLDARDALEILDLPIPADVPEPPAALPTVDMPPAPAWWHNR